MRKNSARVSLLVVALLTLVTGKTSADISWSGNYRVEAVKVKGAELESNQRSKAYLLHHLVLQPKLVAADGINIFGRFDILNSAGAQNVAGQSFGTGPNSNNTTPSTTAGTPSNNSNVFGDMQNPDSPLWVTQLYATWTQEFGVLVVGRSPLSFGLGMSYSDGSGLFDHYMSTRDLIGYKAVLGNLSIMPMIGKMNEGGIEPEDDVNDYMLHAQYANPETDLTLGLFYQLRVSTSQGNDAPANGSITPTPPAAGSTIDGFKTQTINVFTGQRWGNLALGLEGGFVSGDTGLKQTSGGGVKVSSFGIAAELKYANPESKWEFATKLGTATGDDPGTGDTYEGFVFNRNYNVGFLLFNHPLGRRDFLRTYTARDTTTYPSTQIDTEAVSNAMYLAPGFTHRWKERLHWGANFVWAKLDTESISNVGMAKDLGYELDVNLTYKPYERMSWITEVGFLSPGEAFRAGSQALENKFVYGITTKAAISF